MTFLNIPQSERQITSIVWERLRYLLIREYGSGREFTPVINDVSRFNFWIKLYSRGYVTSGKKDEDLDKESRRSISFDPIK